ncbi:MAG TPA: DUF2125 domain-containing protein [Rhizomicrobium sp.]|jgi:hypothetical protein
MRYSSRFFLYAPIAALLTLAAIAMAHWWIVASALDKRLAAVNGHEIMPGVKISFASKRIAGFPFRLETRLDGLRIEVAEKDGPIVWVTEQFASHALAYGRIQAIFEAAGKQTLAWRDASGRAHTSAFLPGTFRASAILENGELVRFDSQIVDLAGSDFRAAKLEFHFRTNKDKIDTYLLLQSAHIAGGYAGTLGPDLQSLIASASLDHRSALDAGLRGEAPPADAIDRWREVGGSIAVGNLALDWKKRAASFSGKLTLDDHHDLNGALHGAAGTLTARGNVLSLKSALLP